MFSVISNPQRTLEVPPRIKALFCHSDHLQEARYFFATQNFFPHPEFESLVMRITVCRKEHFNAAHRLARPDWDQARNEEVFGKCALPNYHGHNYELIVNVTGEVDPETGYVIDMKELSGLMKREVTERFDHRNLNLDVPEFKDLNPTAEHIAFVIYERLRPHLGPELDLSIELYETERNFVRYPAAS